MFTLLLHAKEIFWMDCWVSVSIRGAKSLPFFPTAVKSFTTRGRALPVFSCLPGSRQRGLGQRGRQGSKARVLRQSSILWFRGENKQADRLAKTASTKHMTTLGNILSFVQLSPLIDFDDMQEIGFESDWTKPLVSYLKNGVLPNRKEAARKLKVQAAQFILMKDILYKRGFSRPYLRCLGPKEADYVMREVHEGICRNHSGLRSLAYKLIRAGYYWFIMQKDAQTYVKTYDRCQRFSNIIWQPSE